MRDYDSAVTSFDYLQLAAQDLHGELDALNACIECCDRHAHGDAVALYCETRDGRATHHTFSELQVHAARFGNFLREQGVRPGDRVAGLMPRTVELLIAILHLAHRGGLPAALYRLRSQGHRAAIGLLRGALDSDRRPKPPQAGRSH